MKIPLQIGIIGPNQASENEKNLAYDTGKLIAQLNMTLINGGRLGIMLESARGCFENHGTVIGISPTKIKNSDNPYITHSICTNMGHARNIIIVHSSDLLIAIGKGMGTLSEMAIALKENKPVLSLKSWDLEGCIQVKSINDINSFLENFLER